MSETARRTIAADSDGGRDVGLPPLPQAGVKSVRDLLEQLQASPELTAANKFFDGYPKKSLVGAQSRSILYFLTRYLRPKAVLEIGTFCAGTTEIFAQALEANGVGQVVTTDPHGAQRVPPILQSWPAKLRNRAIFLPLSSMDCFIEVGKHGVTFDLAFIDGNHSYEHALYDLQMAAHYMSPGSVVVMDNFEQAGVYWATKHFLKQNPAWSELGHSIATHQPQDPFNSATSSFPGTSFLLLHAPSDILVTDLPRSFVKNKRTDIGLSSYRFELTGTQPEGVLHTVTFFRSFPHGEEVNVLPEELANVAKVSVPAGTTSLELSFPTPFVTQHVPSESYRVFEIILSWAPCDGVTPLRLMAEPMPQTLS